MKITAWRIVKKKLKTEAFSGEGARLYPGRWNVRGSPLVYTASSLSLAAIEILVHLDSSTLLKNYICKSVSFDKSLCLSVTEKMLPKDWNEFPAPLSTKNLGYTWLTNLESLILVVPSTIIKKERNYLINPLHSDFKKLKFEVEEDFSFDPRLIKR